MFNNIGNKKALVINKKCNIEFENLIENKETRNGRTTITKYMATLNN